MKRKLRIGGLVLLGVLVLAVVGGFWYVRPLLLTGTGYAAHNACALAHLADRDHNSDLPPNPLVPHLRVSLSRDGASASIWGFLATQKAWYEEGAGCTLHSGKRGSHGTLTPVTSGPGLPDGPQTPEIDEAVTRAFGDDLPADERETLGTRAVIVVHKGKIVAERYADGFDAETPQLGWSMAKSVTNLFAGILVEQGRISLDDDHLRPEWTDERAEITVDDLLRMTSGLEWDETYDLGTPITRMLYLEPDMAGYVAGLPPAHKPGEYQQYSSGSTNVLCSVLAERSRLLGVDMPRQLLFAPLGLGSAVLEADTTGNPVCSSYLWATPRDWAVIGQFALQDGVWEGKRMLPENWMAESATAHEVTETEDPGYASGWWANKLPDGSLVNPELPDDAYWASGHDGQRMYIVPSSDLVVVRLGFSPELEGDQIRTDELLAEVVEAVK
ncbi:serine hydrolase domain-containing protein [Enemella sp. A6]|uniref:serine hydrolase domain-containing protein n=1 Tax=Enemella sp. A6 TaxID=3440152 RepID=UPI003EBDE780